MGGLYSRAFDDGQILTRATQLGLERALYAAMGVVARLFPEVSPQAKRLEPQVSWASRELIDRLLIAPVAQVGRTQGFKLEGQLREMLAGA